MVTFDEPLSNEERECIFINVSSVESADKSFVISNAQITKHNPYTISFAVPGKCNDILGNI